MIDNNNSYLNETRKKSDFIAFRIIYPLLCLLFVILNPLSFFALALFVSIIIYILVFREHIFRKTFLYLFAPVYLCFIFIYSISPKVKYLEFKTTHWNWIEVKGEISDFDITWKGGKSRYSSANISYHYTVNNRKYQENESNVIENRSNSVFWVSEKEKEELNLDLHKNVEQYIQERNFKIFYNPKTGESKILMPLKLILLSNSSGFNFVFCMLKVMLLPILLIMLFMIFSKNKV